MRLNSDLLKRVVFLTGSPESAELSCSVSARSPFDEEIIAFLNDVSRTLMRDRNAKAFSDVVTFAFWIRKSAITKLKERFGTGEDEIRLGKGMVFHIAPSNVPVNFAYSLVAGLLCGNANIVRVPSKPFPQVDMLTAAFHQALQAHSDLKPYIQCVRYERDKDINDMFSAVADMRVVWGGDQTIAELRRSPLPPRSGEITFADRYSLAVIDADTYLRTEDKTRVAEDFYNDTFFSDQNACTSPRVVIWTGEKIKEAKEEFWKREHELVSKKYPFQDIQGVNKITTAYQIAARESGIQIEPHKDNLIVRVRVPKITDSLMDYQDNSGYFYEYDCKDIIEMKPLCNDKRCQTIAYIGDKDMFLPLLREGVKGIDRIVPMGRTMDFDLIWDGYQLLAMLTRSVVVN